MNAKNLAVGTPITYHPGDGHRPDDHWHGVIEKHRRNPDGSHQGLTDIRCTDPHRFFNQRAGLVTTVETRKLRSTSVPTPGVLW